MKTLLIGLALATVATLALVVQAQPDKAPASAAPGTAIATFAGGCFWCTESDFEKVPGVIDAVSGYTGGETENPTYQQVSSGTTGHIASKPSPIARSEVSPASVTSLTSPRKSSVGSLATFSATETVVSAAAPATSRRCASTTTLT